MHSFDYTDNSNKDTLRDYPLQGYRVMHWLEDIITNWICDPINVKDERLVSLLGLHTIEDEALASLCITGTPYSPDAATACATPKIVISLAGTEYPASPLVTGKIPNALNGSIPDYTGVKFKSMALKVTVYTESYDGTVLLAGLLEDFLLFNERQLCMDNGSLNSFTVRGSSEITEIKQGSIANAKSLYTTAISIMVTGGITWNVDNQGPVFRGVQFKYK
jgi:hypothetical protein